MPIIRAYSSWAREASTGWLRKAALPILMIIVTVAGAAAQSIPNQSDLKALFGVVGRMHNIDPELLEAIAEVESGGDPLSVSAKGALGLMQLMPATASEFSVLNPFDPVANLMGAADFLDHLRNSFANNPRLQRLPVLLAAYNAGPAAVEKYGGVPPYAETNRYVRRVIERYRDRSAQPAVAPVLILAPQPYIIQLGPGSHAMQLESVVTGSNSYGSALSHFTAIRSMRGQTVAVVVTGTGTAPWIRHVPGHQPAKLFPHQADKRRSNPNSPTVTLDTLLRPENASGAKPADYGNSH